MKLELMNEKVQTMLNLNDQEWSYYGVNAIVTESNRVKQPIIRDFISQFPTYDDELERSYVEVESAPFDFSGFMQVEAIAKLRQYCYNLDSMHMENLIGHVNGLEIALSGLAFADVFYYFFVGFSLDGTYGGLPQTRYEKFVDGELNASVKWSRYLAKISDGFIDTLKSLNCPQSIISDIRRLYDSAINHVSTILKGETVRVYFSVNPYDFLRMSHGNGWSSCHGIDDGDYMGGTVSYALDYLTCIMYVESKGQTLRHRRVAFIYDNTISFSRDYGNIGDENQLLMNVMRELEKIFGTTTKEGREVSFSTHDDALHYQDYMHHEMPTFRFIESIVESIAEPIIGATAICVSCGNHHYTESAVNCCYGRQTHCEHCGDRHDEDDVVYVEDYGMVCMDCADSCHHCGDYHLTGDLTDTNNGLVCEHCLERNSYYQCDECGEYVQIDDTITDEDEETGEVNIFCSNSCRSRFLNI